VRFRASVSPVSSRRAYTDEVPNFAFDCTAFLRPKIHCSALQARYTKVPTDHFHLARSVNSAGASAKNPKDGKKCSSSSSVEVPAAKQGGNDTGPHEVRLDKDMAFASWSQKAPGYPHGIAEQTFERDP
jgi:hypothetical protein